jgi:hypothetical protein
MKWPTFTKSSIRNRTIICLTIILLIGQLGCAIKKPPLRVTEALRAQFGSIAVAPAQFTPETKFSMPAKGRVSGAGKGAAIGTLGFLLCGDGRALLIAFACPPAIAIGTAIGGVYGAVAAESKATVEEAEATLKRALAAMKIQQALGERIFEYARAQTPYTFELLLDQGASTVNENSDYRPLAGYGIDTILEVNVLKFGLQGEGYINPPLHVNMTVHIRLIRAGDNMGLYERKFDYSSKNHKFTEWAANDAELFRSMVGQACQELSDEIVSELFLS